MTFARVGLGSWALAVCVWGCSGSSSTAPPKLDPGTQSDAGDAGGSDAEAPSEAGEAGAVDAGAGEAGAIEAGAGEAGAPSEPTCTAGTYSCDGQTLRLCSASGVPELDRQCATDEYCDARRALCVPQVCTPGALSCDGSKVRICNDAGSDFEPKQTCSVSQTCNDGACQDIACVPNTTFCAAGGVWTCGSDGTTSTLAQHCTADQFCLEKDRVATCNATACFAGDAMCVGNVATQCKPDGSGPKAGGDDCAQTTQTCYSGECRDLLCTPGQKLCDGSSAYLCADGGTSRILLATCTADESCDPASGTCQTRVCDPGKLGCDSTRVVTCNQAGTSWVQSGTDCAASSGICVAGACKALVCTPGQTYCQSDNVYVCGTDGTSSTLYANCGSMAYHCVAYGGGAAYCYPQFCQPSAPGCNGTLLTTCAGDGNTWVPGGTDCSQSNSVCVNAKCTPKVCTPSAQFCADGNVQQCDYQGVTSAQSKFCTYGTYCRAEQNTADCVPTPCLPDTDGCASEKFGHCAGDGMSVGAPVTDCGAVSKVCTLQGCAASATDVLGTSNQVGAAAPYGSLIANIIDVQSARKLTTIEFYLSLPNTRSLVWVVYQKNIVNGYPELDLKYQKTTSGTGTGFQSSGALTLELDAGKTYAVGVSIGDGNFAYYYDALSTPAPLNFAHAESSFNGVFATSLSYYYSSQTLYYSRLTTTA